MKDSDIRAIMLQQFYERRREGYIGKNTSGVPELMIPQGVEIYDALRVCEQLGEHGLLDWKGHVDEDFIYGVGKITAFGVDVSEGEQEPPIAIHIDQSQNINVSGSTAVQIAGANSDLQQTVTQELERLVQAIEAAQASPEQKKEAKSKLGALLSHPLVLGILGPSAGKLIEWCLK